jgi:hypothetical protein
MLRATSSHALGQDGATPSSRPKAVAAIEVVQEALCLAARGTGDVHANLVDSALHGIESDVVGQGGGQSLLGERLPQTPLNAAPASLVRGGIQGPATQLLLIAPMAPKP